MKEFRKNFKNFLVAIMVAVSMATVTVAVPAVTEAATYTKDNLSLSINEGMAVLTVNTANGAQTYQLTKALVTKDGGISADGTVYLIWMNGSIYWYSYQYQLGNIKMQFLDKGAIALVTDSNGNITGYETTSGSKSVLTIEQVKEKLGVSTNTGNTGSTSSTGSTGSTGNTGSTSSTGSTDNTGNTGNTNTVDGKTVTVNNGTVVLKVVANGVTQSYTLATNTAIVESGIDKNNTIWVRYANGTLNFWNYDLQKSENSIKLHTATNNATALVVANNLVTGYYVAGKSSVQSLLTLQEIDKIVNPPVTEETTPKVTYAYRIVTKGSYVELYNSNDERVDIFKLDNGKITYKGTKVLENVKYALFNSKGNLLAITKKGSLIVIKHSSLSKKSIATKISHFNYSKRGLALYAVRKSGTRFKVTKY